jgi:hypothetical protein
MVYRGRIKNGEIVLDDVVRLPEGAEVAVSLLEPISDQADEKVIPTLYDRMKPFIGAAEGLPSDLSEQHDHYLYGLPRQE